MGTIELRPGTTYTCQIAVEPSLPEYYAYIASLINTEVLFPCTSWYVVNDSCYATCSKRDSEWVLESFRARLSAIKGKLERTFKCCPVRIRFDFFDVVSPEEL